MAQKTQKNEYWLPEPGETGWLQMQNQNWTKADNIPAAGEQVTTGTMSFSGGATAPAGWLICDGRELATAVYPALAAYLGPAYAASQTTFLLPDLRGRFVCGAGQDQALGTTGGANTVSLVADNMPAHTHTLTIGQEGSHTHTFATRPLNMYSTADTSSSNYHAAVSAYTSPTISTSAEVAHTHGISMGNNGFSDPHENRPPFLALHIIIKT